jgi:hypothetical protein
MKLKLFLSVLSIMLFFMIHNAYASFIMTDGADSNDTVGVFFEKIYSLSTMPANYSINGGAWTDIEYAGGANERGLTNPSTLDLRYDINDSDTEYDWKYVGEAKSIQYFEWQGYFNKVVVLWDADGTDVGIRVIMEDQGHNYDRIDPVPVPGAVWLLGSGLIGLFGLRRKFKK